MEDCSGDCWLRTAPPPCDPANLVTAILAGPAANQWPSGNSAELYKRLIPDETRILRILAGHSPSTITSELHIMTIPGVPNDISRPSAYKGPYSALSYWWMGTERTHSILCNGIPLPITKHLFSALANLRRPNEDVYLWTDAISIDQNSIAERNAQVRRMMEIFQGASSVVIWLGEESAYSDWAATSMQVLDQTVQRVAIMQRRHPLECMERLCSLFRAQMSLFERPWFHRSWVRQEIGVAKKLDVVCGQRHLSWSLLRRSSKRLGKISRKLAIERYADIPRFSASAFGGLAYLHANWIYGHPLVAGAAEIRSMWFYHAGGIIDLLMSGSNFDATDARDKVYSLLGLGRIQAKLTTVTTVPSSLPAEATQSVPDQVLTVDYAKSVSEIYQSIARYIINRDHNLDILCVAYIHRDAHSDDLPTWTPDWQVKRPRVDARNDYFELQYAAAGTTQTPLQTEQQQPGTLSIKGYSVDFVNELLDMKCSALSLLSTSLDGEDPARADLAAFDAAQHSSRHCTTIAGRLCLVPAAAEAGESIFVLLGSKIPVHSEMCGNQQLYAKAEGLPDVSYWRWKLVGPCCVPDLMYGALIRGLQTKAVHIPLVDVTLE